jgi:chorismate mutase / prephenate dehydrogenase
MRLDRLREELAELDRRLLELVAERQRVASAVGEEKRSGGIPPRDFAQERLVLERGRHLADQLGVPPELTEKLLLLLIESSLTIQERGQVAASGGGNGRRALIVGGAGKMGGWFVRFLASQGFEVEVADPAGEVPGCRCHASLEAVEPDHDLIVVAATLAASNGILHELARRRAPGLIFDIGSLKSPLRTGLAALAAAGARVTSIHPMFGPDTELLSGRHVIFVDVGVPEATEAAGRLFAGTMATRVDMDLDSHDRVIAYVLGLSHAVNIAFYSALAESGEAAPRLAEVSSTTFDQQLSLARAVAEENPYLYFEIQALNDYGTESLAALLYAVERLRSVIRANDQEGFVELMTRGRDYLRRRGGG